MKTITTVLMCACLTLAAGGAGAQDNTKPNGSAEDSVMKKDWTVKDCNDHMTMSKKDGTKKDDATMKMESQCADMMKGRTMTKDGSAEDSVMKKNWTIQDCKDRVATTTKHKAKRDDAATMDRQCADMMKDGKTK
jgi:hypothetical protein